MQTRMDLVGVHGRSSSNDERERCLIIVSLKAVEEEEETSRMITAANFIPSASNHRPGLIQSELFGVKKGS